MRTRLRDLWAVLTMYWPRRPRPFTEAEIDAIKLQFGLTAYAHGVPVDVAKVELARLEASLRTAGR